MVLILLFFSAVVCLGVDQQPTQYLLVVTDAAVPFYPTLARLAHIEGSYGFKSQLTAKRRPEWRYLRASRF